MDQNKSQPVFLSFSEILKILRNRLMFIGLVVGLFLVGTVIYNETRTPLYQAKIKMAIVSTPQELGLPNQSYNYEDYYERIARMETHLAVMKSSEVVGKLLENAEIKALLKAESGAGRGGLWKKIMILIYPGYNWRQKNEAADSAQEISAQVMRLMASIRIALVPDTNLVEVTAVNPNPSLAAAIANSLAENYRDHMLKKKMEGVRGNLAWMGNELQRLRKDIIAAKGSVERFSAQENILSIEQDPEFLSKELGSMRSGLSETQTKAAQLDAEIAELDKLLKSPVKYVPAFLASEVLNEINVKLVTARLELQSLAQRYKHKHPKMIQKSSEVAFLSSQFDLELEKALSSLVSERKILASKEDSYTAMMNQYRIQSTVEGEKGTELTLRQSEVETNQELYQALLRQMKTANISESLLKETIDVIEPARVPLAPFSPVKGMNLIMAFLIGLFTGVVLAILLDFLEAKIVSAEDVERYLNLTVLGALPQLDEEEAGLNIRESA